MSLAAIIAYTGCIKESSKSKLLEAPLLTAGSIILITGAGGAYGGMIRLSGVGEVLAQISGKLDISLIFVSWFLTAFIRIAQGSATVAMITGASLISAIIGDGSNLEYDRIPIPVDWFGSITLSWMNDSGF